MRYRIIFILFVYGILVTIALFVWGGVKNTQTPPALEIFADCLTQKGAVMYGMDSCSWCQKEKAGFKKAWKFIRYVNCSEDPKGCLALGIEATPTWIFGDGKRLVGYQGLEKLAQESGCPLPELKK